MKILYGFLCVLGAIIPFSKIIPWFFQHKRITMLWLEIQYSPIGHAGWWMVLLVTVTVLLFILADGMRLNMQKLWIPIICTASLGCAFGLPVFLLLREFHIEHCNSKGRPLFL